MNTLNQALAFLKEKKELAFATCEQGFPKIRVMQLMGISTHNELNFATNPHKEIWKQINTDPNVELLVYNSYYSVRISGKVNFKVTDNEAEALFNAKGNEILPDLYKSYTDMVYFNVEIVSLDFFDLTQRPPVHHIYPTGKN